MASTLFCFSLFVCWCVHYGNGVQGREFQNPKKGIDDSMKKASVVYADTLKGAAIPEHALQSEKEGYYKVNYTRKLHNQNASTLVEESNLSFNPYANYNPYANEGKDELVYHWALLRTYRGRYTSAKVTINVYGLPQVKTGQASSSTVWVINQGDGSPSNLNTIQAGWHVHPKLYGDYDTHFFVHWTVDANKNIGCYNLICPGFVLLKGSTYVPGSKIKPLSTYNGEQRYITMKISKDPQSGDWWLYHGPNGNESIGYWPKSLFTGLADAATNVDYGGVVCFAKYDRSPMMGSGHFPYEGEGKAASLTNIELDNEPYNPNDEIFFLYETKPDCYKIGPSGDEKLYFGGPGGCQE